MKNGKLSVVYMGTPEFAVMPLESLIKCKKFEVSAVITSPDKPVGRKQIMTGSAVKTWGTEKGLLILQPERIRGNKQFLEEIRSLEPDIIVVAAYGKILPEDFLKIPKWGCVNIHASILPKYRGASPIEQSLLNGDAECGICFMMMDEKMDTGDVLKCFRMNIETSDNCETLTRRLSVLASENICETLENFIMGSIEPLRQDESEATYCKKIKKEDGELDPKKDSADLILRKLKAYYGWPSVYLRLRGKIFKIVEAEYLKESSTEEAIMEIKKSDPSLVVIAMNGKLYLPTLNGVLILKKVQLEGKGIQDAGEFLRGNGRFLSNEDEIAR